MPRQTEPYVCAPRDSVHVFAEVAQYALVRSIFEPKEILDLGAHVGAFALASARKWPRTQIRCWEPDPDNFSLLQHNTRGLHVDAVNAAVVAGVGFSRATFYRGRTSLGGSLRQLGWQSDEVIEVDTVGASTLPSADIVKIDTEGSEGAIARSYRHWSTVRAAFVEWHDDDARVSLPLFFSQHGLKLTRTFDEAPASVARAYLARSGVLVFER